jgi:hypothetical protein
MDEKSKKMFAEIMPTEAELLEADEMGHRILLLSQGKTIEGDDTYTYISVPPSKLIAFKEAEAEGGFYYEDFGEVLASGEEAEPPDDVKKKMEEEYGFNHNFEEEVIEEAIKEQKKIDLVNKYSGNK